MPNPVKKATKANKSSLVTTSIHDTDITTLCELIAQLQLKFEIEKDAKNEAYAFILSRGLLNQFIQYRN